MKFSKKLSVFIAVGTLMGTVVLGITRPVFAQGNMDGNSGSSQMQQGADQAQQQRCERVTNTVRNRVQKYEENKNRYVNSYKKIIEGVENAEGKLDKAGYDTEALKEKLQEVKQMQEQFENHYENVERKMNQVQENACEGNRKGFSSSVSGAKDGLRDVRNSAQNINGFIQGDLKTELEALREQVAEDLE